MPRRLGRPSPDPGLGTSIELCCRHAPGLIDLSWIGKALASQRITAEEPPPALLQIEPAGALGNEDLVDARMRSQPGVGFGAQVTGQVIRDHEEVSFGIISLDIAEQGDVAFRIARSSTAGQLFPIANAASAP